MPNIVPLIPREVIFGNPERAMPQLSPDGLSIAWLAPDEGVLNVWMKAPDGEIRVLTRDRNRGIRNFVWAYDGEHLLYIQDQGGDENWHLWGVNLLSGDIRDLTPYEGAQAQVIAMHHVHPTSALIGINARDPRVHDVHLINLATGHVTLVEENPGDVVGWLADREFEIRGRQIALPDGGFTLEARDSLSEDWRQLVHWSPEDEGQPYGFSPDGLSIVIGDSNGTDTLELRTVSVADGTIETLASHPVVDLSDVLMHPTDDTIQAAGFNLDGMDWQFLDMSIAQDFATLRAAHGGEVHIASRNLDDTVWIVLYLNDRWPASYYRYDRATGDIDFLFTTRPELEKYTLAEVRPVHITSRDGLTLYSYLTLPPNVDPVDLPLVLNVHGGPWARDTWGYQPEAQWLANRGYASLQVNFRGSSGFGKQFLHAGDREWGAKMHDDLLDAVNWAVERGIVDKDRVAIYGGSYGGYAALVGAAFTPDVFACAVDIVGPSNITTLINSIPPYWEPLKKLFTLRVGDPEIEPEFVDSRSPLFKADQIVCPLLIAQGANDPRVKQAESEQIVNALRSRGKEVEYLLFEDEGHGFARPENRLKFYAAAEDFLARCLGGRVEH